MLMHFDAKKSNKFSILVHFLYFVQDAERSAGEQLAGWIFLHRKQNIERELKWQNMFWHYPNQI